MPKMSDAQIRAEAEFVKPYQAGLTDFETAMLGVMRWGAELAGRYMHIVRWKGNDVLVLAISERKEKPDWAAIIAGYRHGGAREWFNGFTTYMRETRHLRTGETADANDPLADRGSP